MSSFYWGRERFPVPKSGLGEFLDAFFEESLWVRAQARVDIFNNGPLLLFCAGDQRSKEEDGKKDGHHHKIPDKAKMIVEPETDSLP
jgi:hypothetical protein